MIPVLLQPEPDDFDRKVRQPGREWLAGQGISLNAVPPKAAELPPFWRRSNQQLWEAYSGVCAYLAIYFEWVTGASSTDHFVAKSRKAVDAYEWANFRLSCLGPNRNKGRFDDVLDPMELQKDTFVLNLLGGTIRPNPALDETTRLRAGNTIDRLKLNSAEHNRMRAKHFSRYVRGRDEETLKELSPFVWYEAKRQGLL
ncbi:hypothetical protein SCOR_25515 [Sulfidibacter corallicola]|uniref:Uncharacterized protein n=1 Tax=Sulfidibacter corallicola TaxID=2818388 RepID=A0A8A4TRU9_SULCO|nr:hypothetical protein [Sulfidibacter corallicola]QTD52243.1 hypothetical protein J3U87_07195 [Sulfidibacter corallicola]